MGSRRHLVRSRNTCLITSAGTPITWHTPHLMSHNNSYYHGGIEEEANAIYYVSKKFVECESLYISYEKITLALGLKTKELRYYMLTHIVQVVAPMDLIKYVLQ